MTPEHPSPPTTRRIKYRERCARGCEQRPPGHPSTPRTQGREFLKRVLGLRAAAPEHSVPLGSVQSRPRESAPAVNSVPRALSSPRIKKGRSQERVLGEVNSDPRALGSPTIQEAPPSVAPQGSSNEVSASERPDAAFKSARGLSPLTAPATLGVSSCHILAEGRGDI